MALFEKNYLPYSNLHELNLDWFLIKFKELILEFGDIKTAVDEFYKWVEENYLQKDGDLVGSIGGYPVDCVIASIADSLSLSKTIIDMINARFSIGYAIDGGWYTDTDPPSNIYDGGDYYNRIAAAAYDVNCIRSDYVYTNVTGG